MTVSLFTVGNTHLGKASPVKLSELNTADAETRDYNSSGDYKRVNQIEVGRNRAPAAGTTKTLSDWMDSGNPYVQWDTAVNRGSAFKLTGGTADSDCSSATACTATFTWTRPTDYEDFDSGIVRQTLWVTECSSAGVEACDDDDPFDGNSSSDRHVLNEDGSPSGTDAQATGLDDETWYIAAARMEWNDQLDSSDPYTQLGYGYTLDGTPGGAGTCTSCANGGHAIIFQTGEFIPCTTTTVGLSTTSGNDGACQSCDNWNTNTRTTVKVNHTGFAQNKTLYHSSGGCVGGNVLANDPSPPNEPFRWASRDGERAYTLNSGLLGSTANSVECTIELCDEGA